ncbi:DUF438 domain-containing protein [Gorillibacterium sp. sgz500922]|uniref:DUF438 domain-containing protein n=1 Tax=Gorillibacterium sp. sgz500922 TaxID=3446694 RepID=UPI003F67B1A8
MSELINNREQAETLSPERQRLLQEIIRDLHNGKTVDEVKARFDEAVGDISVAEISRLEQALMEEEGIPVAEVQRLCSVHAAVFKGSINEIHRSAKPEEQPGHPVHTFKLENREIERLLGFTIALHRDQYTRSRDEAGRLKLVEDLSLLFDLDKHYSRKENLLFPYLEKYGIYGPTKVMWGVDDRIRAGIKELKRLWTDGTAEDSDRLGLLEQVTQDITEMIFKEENILMPMALEKLTEDEWLKIARESGEIGYCLASPERQWVPERAADPAEAAEAAGGSGALPAADGFVRMETGTLSVLQLETLLNHLPVDLTFIDENDVVRYFSCGKERIFARTKAVIGRTVQNCHPPQSVHIVDQLLADFKAGVKDAEDFWIPFKDKFVYIRYFAVRDGGGRYLGTLEFTQNIKPIQELAGQKRIMS